MPNHTLAARLISNFQDLVSERQSFNSFYQEISELVLIRKSNITIDRQMGARQNERLFDSTAIQANRRFASMLQSTLTSPSVRWFDLITTESILLEDEDVARWLQDTSDRMFLAMQMSNMDQELNEAYVDLPSFGVSLTIVEESFPEMGGFGGLNFQTFHVSEYVFEEDNRGIVRSVHRLQRFTPMQALDRWGEENLTPKIKDAVMKVRAGEKRDSEQKFDIIHSVFPRKNQMFPFAPKNRMPFASIYTVVEDKEVIEESGFRRFPYLAPRFSKTPGEKYGRGPAMELMPDIRTLNRIVELELRALIKAVNPMLVTDDDGALGGSIIVKPGGIAYLRKGSKLEYLVNQSNFTVVNLKKQELIRAIEKGYFIDQVLLPPPQNTPMTATEILRRQEQTLALLGPEIGRLSNEMLRPLIRNVFEIMWEAGAFLAPPTALQNAILARRPGAAVITSAFKGPLARAQKLSEVVAAERFMAEILAPAMQINPEAVDNIDIDAWVRFGHDRLGVQFDILRKQSEVDELRENRRAAQAQIEQEQRQQEQLKAAGAAAPALKLEMENAA